MQRYSLTLTEGEQTYSFGIAVDTIGGIFEVLAGSNNITSFEVVDWVEGKPTVIHEYTANL